MTESATGKISFFRLNEVGDGFGPPSDRIDVECVIQFQNQPNRSYGFQLRNDVNINSHRAMFDLLRDAYFHGRNVNVEYLREPNRNNGRIFRVHLLS